MRLAPLRGLVVLRAANCHQIGDAAMAVIGGELSGGCVTAWLHACMLLLLKIREFFLQRSALLFAMH